MIQLTIELTEEDLFNYNYSFWASPENKKYRFNFWVKTFIYACGGAVLVIPIKYLLTDQLMNEKDLLFILSFCILLTLIYMFSYIKPSIRNKVRNMLKDPRNSNLLNKTDLIIDASGITATDSVSKLHYRWNAITRKNESSDYIFLFLNSAQALIIPKKLLLPDQLKLLETLLNQHISLSIQLGEK